MRSEEAGSPVALRSRHHIRFLAELSRRLDDDHESLLPGCHLEVRRAAGTDPARSPVAA